MTAALILAAGTYAGDGAPTKPIGSASSIRRQILVFQKAGIEKIVVITGYDADKLERHCSHMGVVFLHNDNFAQSDMLTSVKIGVEYLQSRCERMFLTPADVPLFTDETLLRLLDSDADFTVPAHSGEDGHPALINASLFGDILGYKGGGGLKGALTGTERVRIEVGDRGVLLDIGDTDEFGDLVETHSLRAIRPEIKVWLAAESGFFGPGAMHLLTLTTETGSLKEACRRMGISYSKGWKIISNIEKHVGYPIINSKQGGKTGGTTDVTPRGLDLLARYESFSSECREAVKAVFAKHFET